MTSAAANFKWNRWDALFFVFLVIQLAFWSQTHGQKPRMEIVPQAPSRSAVKALSLGDEIFYFYILAMDMQNFGDTFGRFTALKYYDYKELSHWFYLLDELNPRSTLVPTLAGYYYSETQNTPDMRYIVQYLYDHAMLDPERNWWWLSQAIYLANHKLEDKKWALSMAEKLAKIPGKLPMWARQMPAFIHEQLGEKEEALAIIAGILDSFKKEEISEGEMGFMHYFIEDRLKLMEEYEKKYPSGRALLEEQKNKKPEESKKEKGGHP